MKTPTLEKMNAALDALNANDTRPTHIRAEYLDQFRTRDDVHEFARTGTGTNDESSDAELEEESEWVDQAWDSVLEYIESRDSE